MNRSLSATGSFLAEITVPDDLRERDQRVLWQYEDRDGRAYLALPDDKPALVIHLTSVGQPDQIIEVRGTGAPDLRRRPWLRRRAFEEWK